MIARLSLKRLSTYLIPLALIMASGVHARQNGKDPATGCTHRPVLMIHGFLGSGDNYQHLARRLQQWGYCPQQLYVYNWNSLGRDPKEPNRLDSTIRAILDAHNASQIDMVGHSAGGGMAYSYLSDSLRSSRVACYVHIGSRAMPQPAGHGGKIPTLNLYSSGDSAVRGANIPGAVNVAFATYDHFGLLAADSVAHQVYGFFTGNTATPRTIPIPNNHDFALKVVQMATNEAEAGATITWYSASFAGVPAGPKQSAVTDRQGMTMLTGIEPGKPYLVECQPVGGRPVTYFFSQLSPAPLPLYLRTLPSKGLVSKLMQGLPQSPDAATLVLFGSTGAIMPQKHNLTLNGDTLNTQAITPAGKTVVALFLYDNGDKQTTRQTQGAFGAAPFMNAIDYYIPAGKPLTIAWNNYIYEVPAIPSAQATTVVVLQ